LDDLQRVFHPLQLRVDAVGLTGEGLEFFDLVLLDFGS
jgi:hypothetical protein